MNATFHPGTVLHHRDFQFEDGTKRDKYLIILGANPGCDCLCVLTTTQQWKLESQRGCHHKPRTYFFIPGDGKNFFLKNTWVVLSDPVIMSNTAIIQKGMENTITVEANLKENITGEIRNCLKGSKDISQKEMQLL